MLNFLQRRPDFPDDETPGFRLALQRLVPWLQGYQDRLGATAPNPGVPPSTISDTAPPALPSFPSASPKRPDPGPEPLSLLRSLLATRPDGGQAPTTIPPLHGPAFPFAPALPFTPRPARYDALLRLPMQANAVPAAGNPKAPMAGLIGPSGRTALSMMPPPLPGPQTADEGRGGGLLSTAGFALSPWAEMTPGPGEPSREPDSQTLLHKTRSPWPGFGMPSDDEPAALPPAATRNERADSGPIFPTVYDPVRDGTLAELFDLIQHLVQENNLKGKAAERLEAEAIARMDPNAKVVREIRLYMEGIPSYMVGDILFSSNGTSKIFVAEVKTGDAVLSKKQAAVFAEAIRTGKVYIVNEEAAKKLGIKPRVTFAAQGIIPYVTITGGNSAAIARQLRNEGVEVVPEKPGRRGGPSRLRVIRPM